MRLPEPVILRNAPQLDLKTHMQLLGLTPLGLASRSGVEIRAIQEALAGRPIAHPLAVKLARYFTHEHGIDIRKKGGEFTPSDLGIKTWMHSAYSDDAGKTRTARQPAQQKPALYRKQSSVRTRSDAELDAMAAQIVQRMAAHMSPEQQMRIATGMISRERRAGYR